MPEAEFREAGDAGGDFSGGAGTWAVHVVAGDWLSRSIASEAGGEFWEGLGILDGSTSTPWFPSGNGDHGAVLCDQGSVSVPGVLLRVSRWSYILIFSNSPGGWEQHGCT